MSGTSLIVVGSGSVTKAEASDLLDDLKAGEDHPKIKEIVFPADDGFTVAVEAVLDWSRDEQLLPYTFGRASRKAKKWVEESGWDNGPNDWLKKDPVDFSDIINGIDNSDILLLVAMPEDDADDYDDVVTWLEAAEALEIPAKDLTSGLDDIVLTEAEDATKPDPEPEPEPAKPAPPKRQRASRAKPKPVAEEAKSEDGLQEEVALSQQAQRGEHVSTPHVMALQRAIEIFKKADESNAAVSMTDEVVYRPLTLALVQASTYFLGLAIAEVKQSGESQADTPKADEPVDALVVRGRRGRPRVNVPEEKQIQDEDGEWVKRPRGRIAKGTKTRTINPETEEVLETGEV